MDNTPSLGSASTIVEQDPNNPGAEWALSNFDRRQQFAANFVVELPFGANRRWLDNGGAVVGRGRRLDSHGERSRAQSGTPFTRARLRRGDRHRAGHQLLAARRRHRRADSAGAIRRSTTFFNTTAFAPPAPGVFGDASRNMIVGPGGRQLNGTLVRDIRLNGNRAVTLQVNATNLFNTVQWTVLDTDINSPTFGHVHRGQTDARGDGDPAVQVLSMRHDAALDARRRCLLVDAVRHGRSSRPAADAAPRLCSAAPSTSILVDVVVRDGKARW